jgi:hypothetical protein
MSNRNFTGDWKKPESRHKELIQAQYLGAVILLFAASAFLALVFVLNCAVDFSRLAY